MKIDIDFYRKAKEDFIKNLRRRDVTKWEVFNNELSLYCSCFGLPVLAAIVFAMEEFPEFEEQLNNKKQSIIEFYDYEV